MSAGVLPETVVAESRLPEGLTGRPESSTSVTARQAATVGEVELLQTRTAWAWGETAAAEVTVALTIPRVAAATSATDARGVRIEQLLGWGENRQNCRPSRSIAAGSVATQGPWGNPVLNLTSLEQIRANP